ncbi:hypothetical protein ACWEQ7_11020 [Streptomyces sp. NPDC004069]
MNTQTTAQGARTSETAAAGDQATDVSPWRPVPVAWRPPRPLDVFRALSGVMAASLGLGYLPDGGPTTAGFAMLCGHGLIELVSGCVRRTGLVRTKRRPINPTDFEVVHVRSVHYLDLDRLKETAVIKPAPRRVARVPKKRPATD